MSRFSIRGILALCFLITGIARAQDAPLGPPSGNMSIDVRYPDGRFYQMDMPGAGVNLTGPKTTLEFGVSGGTSFPAGCRTGQLFLRTDLTAGQNLYVCTTAPSTWTQYAGTGGGGGATIPSVTNLISGNGSGNGADSGIAPATVILSSGSYSNPAWITALANGKITGLGTAAIVNTGVSGATIPLNNGNLILSGSDLFTAAVGISLNATALPAKQTGTVFQFANADATPTRSECDVFGSSCYYSSIAAGGTNASPAALSSGTELGGFNVWGYNGSAIVGPRASLRTYANQTWTTGANGTYVDIATTPNGATAQAEVARFENDAGITVPATVTGGDKGAGTLNAAGLYVAGTAVLTGNQTITLSGNTTGSGATAITTVTGSVTANAPPTVISTSHNNGSGGTNIVISAPASITNGNCLVAVITVPGASSETWTPPPGFSQIGSNLTSLLSSKIIQAVFYKIAASESGSYTFAWNNAASGLKEGQMLNLGGTSCATDGTANATGNVVTLTVGSVTMAQTNDLLLITAGKTGASQVTDVINPANTTYQAGTGDGMTVATLSVSGTASPSIVSENHTATGGAGSANDMVSQVIAFAPNATSSLQPVINGGATLLSSLNMTGGLNISGGGIAADFYTIRNNPGSITCTPGSNNFCAQNAVGYSFPLFSVNTANDLHLDATVALNHVFVGSALKTGPQFVVSAGRYGSISNSGAEDYTVMLSTISSPIASISSAASAVLTLTGGNANNVCSSLASTCQVFPGELITILGATGTGCSGLNSTFTVTSVSGLTVTIPYNSTGCTYGASSASIVGDDIRIGENGFDAGSALIKNSFYAVQTGFSHYFTVNNVIAATINAAGINTPSGSVHSFNGDASISRDAAGVLDFGTGAAGSVAGYTKATASGTVAVLTANLPTCSAGGSTPTGLNSYSAAVSDATAPAIGVALTGGGTVWAHVHCSLTSGSYLVDGI